MKAIYQKWLFSVVLFVTVLCLSGCGSKKEQPEETQKVLKISITPQPTPTPAAETLNQDAIVRNGTITMINEYTVYGSKKSDELFGGDEISLEEEITESQDAVE